MTMNRDVWRESREVEARNYTCGHVGCGREVASDKGWSHMRDGHSGPYDAFILICPQCKRPSFIDDTDGTVIPGMQMGAEFEHLPSAEMKTIWNDIRSSTGQGAYTAAVLASRKLLMHVAVQCGAGEGKKFVEYVDYLIDNHYAPPNSKEWVDKIRQMGNMANHELKIMSESDAKQIITFLEMLLKFQYEFPAQAGVI